MNNTEIADKLSRLDGVDTGGMAVEVIQPIENSTPWLMLKRGSVITISPEQLMDFCRAAVGMVDGKTLTTEEALKAIEDEPEYPGKMPNEMKETLRKAMEQHDMDLLVEALRITVRLTKEGIRNRITTARHRKGSQ